MSSSSPILGRLEPVALRTVWSREDNGFTPWLAEPANLDLLAATLGLELELEGTEKSIGLFRADILCREVRQDRLVLIRAALEYARAELRRNSAARQHRERREISRPSAS